jgi:hypothetical protein
MLRPPLALALLLGCGAPASDAAGPDPGPAPAETPCNAVEDEGRLAAGRTIEVLRRVYVAGDLLQAALDCSPPDAVQLELEGPLGDEGVVPPPDRHVWTEFPRPLPPNVEACPREGCGSGGEAWLPPGLERRIAVGGEYVLRLHAPERDARCSVCIRVEPAP